MKLSTNFVKDYVDITVENEEDVRKLAEEMTRVGNEYDSAKMLISATKLVIGEILECTMHPDSDHLHLCTVNIGGKEPLKIVCGAPNARKGIKVIVALDGAILPDKIIKKGMIRGQESNGMLCSMEELGIESKFLTDEQKKGIEELPEDAIPGENPIEYLCMKDGVIDFDLTANRGDLLSILGMAYEIGAIYNKPVKNVDTSYEEDSEKLKFNIEVNTENCKLFLAKKVMNVQIKESPTFIKNRLIACGIRPINNVVDISNYVMLELGQPLHFYDADTLQGKLEVRMAKEQEELTTLDNVKRNLSEEDIVISDGTKAIGLAGVMGGLETEITEKTKNIIIESAIFDSVKVRKTSNKILRSEASNRFEKGIDPNRTYMAIDRACNLLQKYANVTILGGMEAYDVTKKEDKTINITFEKINEILGFTIPDDEILQVFARLGFKTEVQNRIIEVTVPQRRLDVNIPEDLIEEVGRIYGVDNIIGKLPKLPLKTGSYDKKVREIRNKMISMGMNETLSYVLVSEKEAKNFVKNDNEVIKLLAPLTEERDSLRHSIITSLYKIYENNMARGNKDICLFEIGKTFYKNQDEYKEENKMACLMSGNYELGLHKKEVDFYNIKGVVEELLDYLGYSGRYSFVVDKEKMPKEFHPGQTACISINNDIVGIVGKVHPAVTKENVFVMEIDLDKIANKKVGKMKYKEFSKFPGVKKDLAVIVDKELTSQEIAMVIKKSAGNLLKETEVFDVYMGEGIPEGKKSLAFTLSFEAQDRTLTDEETNQILQKVIEQLEKKLKAEIRK